MDRGFTGQTIEPGLGLHDYVARHYAQPLGRWIAPDTIVPDPTNPQTLNRYSYALNNALRYIDPTGHQTVPAPVAPVPQDWAQVWQFVQAVGGLLVSLGPEAALVTAVGVTHVSAAVIGTAWAMQDIGPDYQTPSEYVPGSIQASHAFPNAGTVPIDTAADSLAFQLDGRNAGGQEQSALVLPAKVNPKGNRGAPSWEKPGGQNFSKDPEDQKPAPFSDSRTRRMSPEQPMVPPAEDVLKNLNPDRIGWPRFLLAKMGELIDAVMGNVPQ
ncbi:MAG: RHS repeat-associated core domain-containing protein [Anaerolineae bacterium]